MKNIANFLAVIMFVLFFYAIVDKERQEANDPEIQKLRHDMQQANTRLEQQDFNTRGTDQSYVSLSHNNRRVSEKEINTFINNKYGYRPQANTSLWYFSGQNNAAASALGLDNRHHFVNAYLIDFQPFDTQKIWVPLYTLALRKTYQYDHLQYPGKDDIWQNSYEAYRFTRGDCEDHAVMLADWLIAMGEDARVVLGKFKNEGHAWVVLFKEGKQYVLEATDKFRRRTLDHMQLAIFQTGYRPEFMFNREAFWENTGSTMTTNYNSQKWIIRNTYVY